MFWYSIFVNMAESNPVVLADIAKIKENIKSASTKSIKTFHKFIFENTGDRNNRSRLRQFKGWNFQSKEDENFKLKFNEILNAFEINDLVNICSVLSLDSSGNQDEIVERLLLNLSDFNVLKQNIELEETDDEIDEDSRREITNICF